MPAAFDAAGVQPAAVLPKELEEQVPSSRATLSAGNEPPAAVILLEFEVVANG